MKYIYIYCVFKKYLNKNIYKSYYPNLLNTPILPILNKSQQTTHLPSPSPRSLGTTPIPRTSCRAARCKSLPRRPRTAAVATSGTCSSCPGPPRSIGRPGGVLGTWGPPGGPGGPGGPGDRGLKLVDERVFVTRDPLWMSKFIRKGNPFVLKTHSV